MSFAAGAVALALFGGVAVAAPATGGPGNPGEKNCFGQTMAYLAHGGEPGAHGIGNAAAFAGLSVQDLKDAVRSYCAAVPPS